MPIHLPPISRRGFLVRSLLAGAGAALAPRLVAAGKPANPHAWALLADTHIDANPGRSARGVIMADHLKSVATGLAALAERPSGVLINGDCAYLDGQPGDYATLTSLLEPVRGAGIPVTLTLGNHDHRENFRSGVAEGKTARRPLADKHVAVVRSPRVNWFFLDSLDKVNVTPGLLGSDQLAWLVDALDKHADRPAIVCAHHNLADGESKGVLNDTEALLAVLAPRRHVKAYVFGHTHNWRVLEHDSGIHLVNLPPVAYVFRPERPSGWIHATVEPGGLRLKLHALDQTHPEHGAVKELTWRA
jgi:Icc protein